MSDQPDMLKDKLIIGIDLGTTKSAVAVWNDQAIEVLNDSAGRAFTPSIVGWDRERHEWLIGHAARDLGVSHPGDVIYSIKRYIGRSFSSDPSVLYGRQDLTYTLISGGGTDQLRDVVADLGEDRGAPLRLSAPEVSAKVLAKLRDDAAAALGIEPSQLSYAVITVPAYFNVLQRRATILAGKLAGLEVVGILNEPTAAALAYSGNAQVLTTEERRILIYDLGGGTFDISLLEARRDDAGYLFYTLVVDGNTRLGGDDIDASVARWIAEEIERLHDHPVRPDDQVTRARLRRAAEQAKIDLTTRDSTTIDLPALDLGSGSPFDMRIELTRAQLEQRAAEVVRKTIEITRRAVEDVAGLGWDKIDEVILVGGPTLMPIVQREVERLTGRRPLVSDQPQLTVALGAGEYAHILSQGQEKFQENALINVIALPLGIRLDDDTFEPLVEANATVPHTSRAFPVTTTEDNQKTIHVEVLQGPRGATRADQCVVLGSVDMEVPAAPARTPKFEIIFDVQSDGTMKAIVNDTRRNRTATLDIVETRTLTWRDRSLT
ncbi:MAG: Hsp70 family protein [Kouleothrix sp.]|nr:Hsp70 family protein [Kouleothrix sp.]